MSETRDERKSIPELAPETRLLEKALRQMEPGQEISYETLSRIAGRNVQRQRHNLATARSRLAREGKVFEPVHGKGMKRLTDEQIVKASEAPLRHIRRCAQKAQTKLAAVNFDGLSVEDRTVHNAHMTLLNHMRLFGTSRIARRVKGLIAESGISGQLDAKKLLGLFEDGKAEERPNRRG